jgi:hypothetical protein
MQIKEMKGRKFTLTNVGSFPLEFNCSFIRSSLIEGESTTNITPVAAKLQQTALVGRSKIEREAILWEKVQSTISFNPDSGTVQKNEQTGIELKFNPQQIISIQSLVAAIKITNGPTYYFNLSGGGYRPQLEFEWLE